LAGIGSILSGSSTDIFQCESGKDCFMQMKGTRSTSTFRSYSDRVLTHSCRTEEKMSQITLVKGLVDGLPLIHTKRYAAPGIMFWAMTDCFYKIEYAINTIFELVDFCWLRSSNNFLTLPNVSPCQFYILSEEKEALLAKSDT
jgi:hypothetical protein